MVDAIKLLRSIRSKNIKNDIQSNEFPQIICNQSNDDNITNVSRDILISRNLNFKLFDNNIQVTSYEDTYGIYHGGTGATLWDCSIVLTEYLLKLIEKNEINSTNKILELGAGLGLPSIALAKVNMNVTTSERQLAFPLLELNIEKNNVTNHINIIELDWKQPQQNINSHDSFDIIIGSDLFFNANRDIWNNLIETFEFLLSSSKSCICYLAYENRNTLAEDEFMKLLSESGIRISLCHVDSSSAYIYIYKLMKDCI